MLDDTIHLLVDDALIARYRSTFEMKARQWQDQHIRGYVLALSMQITVACMMDWQDLASYICNWLARLEPLEEIRESSYEGHLLWIIFNGHAVRDPVTTRNAIDAALARWPQDAQILKMREEVARFQGGQR